MFADPTMLDDLDFLFKSDAARRLMFYYQPEYVPPTPQSSGNRCKDSMDKLRPNMVTALVNITKLAFLSARRAFKPS